MKKVLAMIFYACLFFSGIASATSSSTGPVTYIFIHEPDVLMFAAGTISGTATCSQGTNQWAISLSSPMGKSLLATLMQAQALGANVTVFAYGDSCTAWGDRLLPSYVGVVNQ